jgi:hypothetical protein
MKTSKKLEDKLKKMKKTGRQPKKMKTGRQPKKNEPINQNQPNWL